ncbi:hypothetical protein MMC18_005247 [Xylographa bjoerkii]|nr:hypothetical protein [Xylographa bjoerkii]
MPGGLACPSPRLLHQWRYLAHSRISSPRIVCFPLAFLDDTRASSGLQAYSTTASQKPENIVTSAVWGTGLSTNHTRAVGRGQRKADTKNIFVDNLQATLEAHQAANKAKLIHKVKVAPSTGLGFKNLKLPPSKVTSSLSTSSQISLDDTLEHPADIEEASLERESLIHGSTEEPHNPQDLSRLSSEHQSSTARTLEYKGRYRVVQGQWRLNGRSPLRRLRQIPLRDDEVIDSELQLVIPKATDGVWLDNQGKPWITYVETQELDGMLRLNAEIKAFEKYMKPTSDEENSTQAAIASARSIIAAVAPTSVLTIHGSRHTGIANPLSDIDFSVSLPEYEKNSLKRGPSIHRPEAQRAGMKLLKKIELALRKAPQYSMAKFIHARVDLVTAVDRNTQLQLQFQTLASFLPAREYSMYYLSEFAGLRPLYILLRHFLLMRGLTGARDGGIGSYPLLILIVAAFKHSHQTFAPEDLGLQLLHVLKFWSTADLYTYGYSADPPTRFTKIPPKISLEEREERLADPILKGIDIIRKPKEDLPFLLCLQDPGNPTNDLGKRITEIKNIQACFTTARNNLVKSLGRWETLVEYKAHERGRLYTFLDSLLGANYSAFERGRRYLANAHKLKQQRWFKGQMRLQIYARKSVTTVETETGPRNEDDSIVSTSNEPDSMESLSPGTSLDS